MMRSRSALHRQWPSLVAAAAALFVFACHEEPNEGDDIARLAAMKQEILHLVGDAACNEPKDCRAIGLGAKPCGGPWEYLVYSRSSVDEATLQDLVARYNVFNEVLNRRYGWTSDCRVATPPPVNCVDGHCAAVQPGLAGTWDLIGYADHGVEGSASGTATFAADGTFTITGQVTYPGEPTDPLELGGTYVFAGDRVELTTAAGTGTWRVDFASTAATLTRDAPPPTNVIRLRRAASSDAPRSCSLMRWLSARVPPDTSPCGREGRAVSPLGTPDSWREEGKDRLGNAESPGSKGRAGREAGAKATACRQQDRRVGSAAVRVGGALTCG